MPIPSVAPAHDRRWVAAAVLAVGVLAASVPLAAGRSRSASPGPLETEGTSDAVESGRMPAYDAERRLLLPDDYREWIFAGSSLGLAYGPEAPSHEMFQHVFLEPTAYRHWRRTGEFREGTMFVLMLHGEGENVLPGRQGSFAAEIHGIEMAVKDSSRVDEGWAYYGFGGMMAPPREAAEPMPKSACFSCHAEHAQRDNVFLQFYPLLEEAAP